MLDLNDYLKRVSDQSQDAFKGQKRILSFQQYLEAFCANPVRLGRNAPQYVLDVYDHYGTKQTEGIGGRVTRWKLFDAPWENGRDSLQGQEQIQQELHRHLHRFAVTGSADKLVLLHGPN